MWADFHFLRPGWLWLLPPLFALAWYALRPIAGGSAWRRVVDAHLLPHLLDADGRASRLPLALVLIGGTLLVIALAGPTWHRLPQPVYQAPYFRVVVLDLSLSMNAADLKPSRLAQARFKVIDLVQQVADGQSALIGYGAEPFIVSPLTSDAATIVAQVPLLSTDLLPVNGPPRADLALRAAGDLLRQAGAADGEVVLLSDDVEEIGRAVDAARELRQAGHRVSVVGIGTPQGAPLPLPGGGFVRDAQGVTVVSRLDTDALSAVATAGGGRYVAASLDNRDLAMLAPDRLLHSGDVAHQEEAKTDQWREEGPWLMLLLLPLAALAFRRGWLAPLLVAVCVLPPPDALAIGWDDLWLRADQQGMRAFERGDAAQAADRFERPDWRAAAAYRAGDYARALELLGSDAHSGSAYNAGNALARLGRLEDAVTAYDEALQVDPQDADARHNRDLVRRLLEQQQRQDSERDADERQDDAEQKDGADQQQAQREQGGDDDSNDQGDSASQQDQQQAATDATAAQDGEGKPQSGDDPRGGSSATAAADRQSGDGDRSGTGTSGDKQKATTDSRLADSGGDNGSSEGDPVDRQDPDGDDRQAADATPAAGDGGETQETAGVAGEDGASSLDSGKAVAHAGDGEPGLHDAAAPPQQAADAGSRAADGGQGLAAGRRPDRTDLTGDGPVPEPASPRQAPRSEQGERLAGGSAENQQALEQMLRRVEDDPGGLLRQRFLLQHLRRNGQLP